VKIKEEKDRDRLVKMLTRIMQILGKLIEPIDKSQESRAG